MPREQSGGVAAVVDFLAEHRATAINVGIAVLVVIGAWLLIRLMRRAVDQFLTHRALAELDAGARTRFRMIERLAAAGIAFLGIGLALYVVDVGILRKISVAMFASAGLVGIALGFASQTTAANLISGVIIAFVQPLRLGDRVRVEDEYGQVEEIGLFYTSLKTWDNRRIVIPNQLLSNKVIKNYTIHDARMAAGIVMRLDFTADLDAVRSTLLELARAHPLFIPEPEPEVEVVDTDDSGVSVRLTAWAADQPDAWKLGAALREQALKALAAQGVPISARRIRLIPVPSGAEVPSGAGETPGAEGTPGAGGGGGG
ncbi:MAG: mechanosensitive ion channel family protein [Actinobacteria bacterium]|nr:mechanosensitive ion channel family protein [Actinomycetota bacterium]